MVTHMVLLRMKRNVEKAAIERFLKSVGELRRTIPGITGYSFGPYSSPEGLNRGYTHGFCMTFESTKARDVYLTHVAHEKVKVAGVELLEGGIDGVLAFDFES
jgi:hypothetical protein